MTTDIVPRLDDPGTVRPSADVDALLVTLVRHRLVRPFRDPDDIVHALVLERRRLEALIGRPLERVR